MAKYQGWRGAQGNFRGKVEERVQQKGNRSRQLGTRKLSEIESEVVKWKNANILSQSGYTS